MNPGTSIAPCASTTRFAGVTSFCTSALEPPAASRLARTATAPAHGRAGSPVHTWALTLASVIGSEGVGGFTREARVRRAASVAAAAVCFMIQFGAWPGVASRMCGPEWRGGWWRDVALPEQGDQWAMVDGGPVERAVGRTGRPMVDGGPVECAVGRTGRSMADGGPVECAVLERRLLPSSTGLGVSDYWPTVLVIIHECRQPV